MIQGSFKGGLMAMDNLISIVASLLLLYLFVKNRKELKKTYQQLSFVQMIGVFIAYLITIFIAFILIFYVGNWLVSYVPYKVLKYMAFLFIVIVVISTCLTGLNKVLKKITNNIL